jgi:hypothetical protein
VDVKRPVEAQLHIERLVLRGFSALDAQRVRDAFAAALAEPWPEPASEAARHDRLTLPVRDAGSPEALGRSAAQALRQALR